MLASVLSGLSGENDQISYIAGLILKNTIKSFYDRLEECFSSELKEIEYICYLILVREGKGHVHLSKKIFSELVMILVNIVKRRFFEDSVNLSKNELLVSIISEYQQRPNAAVLECLIQIFENVDDDRMS